MNLVVQGPGLRPQQAEDLARLADAEAIEPIAASAWRLRQASHSPTIAAWCAAHRLDCAWVPAGRRFADLRVLAIDMDSTLITIECIDEIGALLGRKRDIASITEEAMRGDIGFAESLTRRVALLAGLEESALERVYEDTLRLSPGAERLLDACKAAGVKVLLISGGFSFFTDRLKARLGLDATLANALEIVDGRLTGCVTGPIVDAEAKAAHLRDFAGAIGAAREQTLAVGDGANDLRMLAAAGTSVAWRAKPVLRAAATYALDYADLDGARNLFE